MVPSTAMMMNSGGSSPFVSAMTFVLRGMRRSSAEGRGATDGLTMDRITMYAMYRAESRNPGTKAAMNSLPTDICAMGP